MRQRSYGDFPPGAKWADRVLGRDTFIPQIHHRCSSNPLWRGGGWPERGTKKETAKKQGNHVAYAPSSANATGPPKATSCFFLLGRGCKGYWGLGNPMLRVRVPLFMVKKLGVGYFILEQAKCQDERSQGRWGGGEGSGEVSVLGPASPPRLMAAPQAARLRSAPPQARSHSCGALLPRTFTPSLFTNFFRF